MSMGQLHMDVRPSPIAGQWYPGSPNRLAQSVDAMLDAAPPAPIDGRLIGLVSPHAGYMYSGPVAADAYRLLRGMEVERVVIVGPMHHMCDHPVLTTSHDAYRTPLGEVPVDREMLDALAERVPIHAVRRDPEHSVEIQLPFLQCALVGEFRLTPLMLRDQNWPLSKKLGHALAEVIGDEAGILLIASSDLSHFHPDQEARKLDKVMLDEIAAFRAEGVIRADDEERASACGRGAIATVLVAARDLGADRVEIVGYATSADTSGDYHRVVGYGAAVIYQAT
jgi:AmmeMemoRadiSam system protein B